MNEKFEQIKAVMSDEAFVKTCIEAENEETVQKLFADKGIEMSLTEIELMKETVGAVADGNITVEELEKLTACGELSEDELSTVAGGDILGSDIWNNIDSALAGLRECKLDTRTVCEAWRNIHMAAAESGKSASNVGPWIPAAHTNIGAVISGAAVGVIAVAGLGYGVYDAVRRRW